MCALALGMGGPGGRGGRLPVCHDVMKSRSTCGAALALSPVRMKLKMENLAEQIAAELGKKWVQLYSRLGLGARDRYRFITEHKDEPSPAKEMKCGRDTIRSELV